MALNRRYFVARIAFVAAFLLFGFLSLKTTTKAAATDITYNGRTIATKASSGTITYIPKSGDNTADLNYLLSTNTKKSVVIPKGSNLSISNRLNIGNNTTLTATGATITQTTDSKGLLYNAVDGTNYNSVVNVTINGGTWKAKSNKSTISFVRFTHGKGIKLKNMTIVSNYNSHAIELIACRDVVVYGCTLKAQNNGTKSATSVEDAIQIDVATPATAPGVYSETGDLKYVNGQVCQNIRVENCTITGARGICANYTKTSDAKYINSYHKNITIINNKITGVSSQGISLNNTIGCLIQGNVVKTTSTQNTNYAYASAISLQLFGTKAGGTNKIVNNKIYGKIRGVHISKALEGIFGKTTITGNTVYIKKSYTVTVKDAQGNLVKRTSTWIGITGTPCKSVVQKSNTTKYW